jgi:hypothetical protein
MPPTRVTSPKHFHSSQYIGGLTHNFYRYPAAASPDLIRELIATQSAPGDVIFDPFMGGGTTIVEALASGRLALGSDLNTLALFVSRVKTTPLTGPEWEELLAWLVERPLGTGVVPEEGNSTLPLALRRPIGRALSRARSLRTSRQEAVIRCALLRVGQWALESSYLYPRRVNDRRNILPSMGMLHAKLDAVLSEMRDGMGELTSRSRDHNVPKSEIVSNRVLLKSAAEDLHPRGRLTRFRGKARLILTSPPYPNVHVLYHRWQVEGRRETTAPYWIAGQSDGATLSYYIMGSRSPHGQRQYFLRLERAFAAVRPFISNEGLVMQLVAFNRATEQLPRYLAAMERAGYRSCHGRRGPTLVREIPHRRWYVSGNDLDAGREYLLLHAPAR